LTLNSNHPVTRCSICGKTIIDLSNVLDRIGSVMVNVLIAISLESHVLIHLQRSQGEVVWTGWI